MNNYISTLCRYTNVLYFIGIALKGTKQVLELSLPPIVHLATDIVMCKHTINKPGMPKFFTSPNGTDYLESLEIRNKVRLFRYLPDI